MEDIIDPWGEDGDDFVGSCDCCDVGGGIMTGLAWATSFMIWIASLVALAATGRYVEFAASFIAGMVVFWSGLYGW
jgi:hypothetical protein